MREAPGGMVGGSRVPHIASMGDAAKYARAGAIDTRGVAEGRAAVEPPTSVATPDGTLKSVRRLLSLPPFRHRTPPAPQRPPAFLPGDAKPVARVAEPPITADSPAHKDALAKLDETRRRLEDFIPKPVEPPPVAKPAAPVSKRVGSRIDQPSAQALVDELRKRFGVEKPVPVTVSNAGAPTTLGFLSSAWDKTTKAAIENFRRRGIVDPAVGTPRDYAITVRSDPSDRALSVGTLLHEFGHVLQNEKYRTASPETRAAILAAFHRETQVFGKLSPEEFPATALDSVVNARVKDLETRLNDEIVASSHQEYNQRFNEWFANQVSTWLTTTREATGVVDKFFKGIADAWKDIYRRVTGRQGAAPEIDAYMRGMWDEGKAAEEAPRTASGEATPDRAASRVQMTGGEGGAPHDEDDLIGEDEPLPVARGDLGAAGAPPGPALPDRPTRETAWEQEDRFNRLAKAPWADKSELLNTIDSWPKRIKTAAAQERLYRHMEDPSFTLTPQEQADYDQFIKPLKREELALWEEARKTDLEGIEDFDPTYAHRMVKERNPQFDRPLGVGGADDGPLGGQNRLPQSTSSMKPRVFYAIQDVASGERKIVARSDDGSYRIVDPGRPSHPVSISKDVKVGDAIPFDNRVWTFEQAHTHEIEAVTDLKYYKNAGANTIDNIVRLRQVVRAIHEVERLKSSPEWAAYARKVGERGTPHDWREPKMPLFRGWRVHPRLADVIDDFYGHEPGSLTEKLAKISRWSVGTMFWSFVTHIANVETHWFTARGWDNVTPRGMLSLAVDGARAFREVVGRGEKYQQLLRDGNGLLYASTSLQKFNEIMLKRLGEDVKRNPAKWDPIARTLGVGPSDIIRMIYEGSSRILWSASDMFMMQRVLELERKGMTTRQAIEEAERHIPNYRAHSEILGSRMAAQAYFNPALTEFSRYHYGQLNSWANIAKDAVGGGKDALGRDRRFQALGNVMATGFMMVLVAPLVNEELKKAFGPKVRLPARGSTTLAGPVVDAAMQAQWAKKAFPKYVRDYYNDDSDLLMTAQNLFAIAPVVRGFGEALTNVDWFSGRRVAEPAEMSGATHALAKGRPGEAAGHAARFGLQEAEHAGERLVQPYYALSRIMQGDKGLVKGILEQGLGLTEPNTAGIAAVRRREEKEAGYRRRHPRGPLEELGGILP